MAASMDLESGSTSSGSGIPGHFKKSEGQPDETKTTSSIAREEGEEINYHTLSWW